MAYLVIDLDLTVFVNKQDTLSINKFHELSPTFWGYMEGINAKYELCLINPDKLKILIKSAYNDHDGVIILTAGLWHKNIIPNIAAQLNLNKNVHNKFLKCGFINPFNCKSMKQFNHLEISDIQKLSKGERIAAHMQEYDFPKTKKLVLLDDTAMHVNSFTLGLNGQGNGVIAKTSEASYKFYEDVYDVLQKAKAIEGTLIRHPFLSELNSSEQAIRYRAKQKDHPTESRTSTLEPHRKIYSNTETASESICDFCCTFM